MRILYIDIDSLRPDHLGCYGYHRNTSPNIDAIAEEGVRFTNVYATDAPCAPSRTALWSGTFGFRNGVVGHGGMDDAHQVLPHALNWLEQHGQSDNWFLHVNLWDPHTPYSTPESFGNPFADDPLPAWMTEEMRQAGWNGYGPHSPQEVHGYGAEEDYKNYPRLPKELDSLTAVKQWLDGYDTGIRYADEAIGQLVTALKEAGLFEDTIIIVSADHGENQGELNVWGDHQTADQMTCNIPLIVRWPGLTDQPRIDSALHYHFDWAATLIELAGGAFHTRGCLSAYLDHLRATDRAHHADHLLAQHPDEI